METASPKSHHEVDMDTLWQRMCNLPSELFIMIAEHVLALEIRAPVQIMEECQPPVWLQISDGERTAAAKTYY
ncbi:hypothetical protein CLAFUW4_07255 [Fulvia fulva]|uniref:Uncharacterized protein n=1 Tax=Passalora fulva TaxID=5499 RepID=A0A9Q8PBA8_PASFU|nr:uncharacterized protein CLAFUR5_07385 [Fulvia fulva]KAK4621482.1 hypothetical protein CLAFUR4_07263 [Fulvia fulva]KAK4623248.1 hypothetical protein CLAFUR0_07260 [Fulvia fulva]UJO19324.1 hypothetical protein CLAFUR5_07385 [Fulvia fulva]WPV16679.1 hypothetical protein CLAFUW4_07255 [Fulvia fulva]WPV31456.1 hypothetical protein CLAFUW7_07256 [Fulvia fulva]